MLSTTFSNIFSTNMPTELMGFSDTVMDDLKDIRGCKVEDDKEEEEFQGRYGPRPVSQVCASLWKELETLGTYHEQGVRDVYTLEAKKGEG